MKASYCRPTHRYHYVLHGRVMYSATRELWLLLQHDSTAPISSAAAEVAITLHRHHHRRHHLDHPGHQLVVSACCCNWPPANYHHLVKYTSRPLQLVLLPSAIDSTLEKVWKSGIFRIWGIWIFPVGVKPRWSRFHIEFWLRLISQISQSVKLSIIQSTNQLNVLLKHASKRDASGRVSIRSH